MKKPVLTFIKSYIQGLIGSKRFFSRKSLESYQQRKLRAHLKWLKKMSPYYSKHHELPMISKAKMMEYFNEMNTKNLKKEELFAFALGQVKSRDYHEEIEDITVGLSSGTSGNRGLFAVTDKERAAWAGYVLGKMLPKFILHKQRIALFLRAGGPLYESIGGIRIKFKFFDIFKSIDSHVDTLKKFNPTILTAPPSVLCYLARLQNNGIISLNLDKVISAAEVLDEKDSILIEKAFGKKVHQLYQATEGCIASTCAHGTLHLHEDLMIIEKEKVDEKSGRFIPVITDFTRRAQPIIRYRLDDVLIEKKEKCPCGSKFMALDGIEGRCDDTLILESEQGSKKVHIFPDFIRRGVIFSSHHITEYKVVQQGLDDIEIQFLSPNSCSKKVEEEIYASLCGLFKSQGAKLPNISFSQWRQGPFHQKLRKVYRGFILDE
jgi:putative adenylate-forming enzyme